MDKKLQAKLQKRDLLQGRISLETGVATYQGPYEAVPKVTAQTVATKGFKMVEDMTIEAIPYFEVSNPEGGKTVIIGG